MWLPSSYGRVVGSCSSMIFKITKDDLRDWNSWDELKVWVGKNCAFNDRD